MSIFDDNSENSVQDENPQNTAPLNDDQQSASQAAAPQEPDASEEAPREQDTPACPPSYTPHDAGYYNNPHPNYPPQYPPQYRQNPPYNGNQPYYGAPGAQPPYNNSYNQPYNQFNNGPVPPKKKSQKAGAKALIACVCVILVIAGVVLGVQTSKGITNPEVTTTNSNGISSTTDPNAPSLIISDSQGEQGTVSPSGTLTSAGVYNAVKDINVGVLIYSNDVIQNEGSGIVATVDSTGKYTYIITCAHVISSGGSDVRVQLSDGTVCPATIVGYDSRTDIGVLKIEKTGLTSAAFADTSSLVVGQTVYAIGNPGGTEFFGSFTSGMISAIDRPIDSTIGYSMTCIQHNAAINPGNSGGALVNDKGQVIGINSSKIADTDYEGMGFAVPSSTVKTVFDELVKNGYVSNRPKLGILYYAASNSRTYSMVVQFNDLPAGTIYIDTINSDSDLKNTSVQTGDLIIAANGKELEKTTDLAELVESAKVGDTITLTVCRIGNNYKIDKTFDVRVKLVEDKGTSETQTTTAIDPFNSFFGY